MDYDLIVIGSGPGGYVAAIRAAQLGLKTACIEKNETLGGTCLNVGCIPSKTLLQATEHYSWLKETGASQGIIFQQLGFDFATMMKRKEEVVHGLVQGIGALFKKNKVESIKGAAKLLNGHEIQVNDRKLSSNNILLATGSEPISLPFLPFDESQILSSTGALALKEVPKRMIVIGGGVIGVELASVYRRLGCEVTIIEMLEEICIAMDPAVRKTLLQLLKKQGIVFHLGAKVLSAEKTNSTIRLTAEQGGKQQQFEAEKVLVAIGRRPYSKDLGEIGIKMEKGFVAVDQQFRSSIPSIYAIGDLIQGPMLAHRASEEGVVVAELIAGHQASVNYMAIPNIIYTHPEVASVGLTEEEFQRSDRVIGISQFRGNPRARCNADTDGFVKVIGAGEALVGMHIIGPQASEMIHTGMTAILKKMSLKELAHAPFGHPTLSEAIKEACGEALGIAIHHL